MGAVTIGPVVLAGDRLAVIVGLTVFMIVTAILSARVDLRIGKWSAQATILGLVAARLGHVAENSASFMTDPLRIFAVWQGGFPRLWAAIAVAIVLVYHVRTLRLALWSTFALGLSLVAWSAAWQLTAATAATPMPAAVLEHVDGRQVALAEVADNPIVINLWATWCPPCRREMPMMTEVAARTNDVVFLFINQGEGRKAIQSYLAATGLAPDNILLDPFHQIGRHYGASGLPTTLFLGRDGQLRSSYVGEMSRETLLDAVAQLKEKP